MVVAMMVRCRRGVVMAGVMRMIHMLMVAAGVWMGLGLGLGKDVLMGIHMNAGMPVYVIM